MEDVSRQLDTTAALIDRVVKERCANLILTGKRSNQGNHRIWREYAEGTARALQLLHITKQLDRVQASATKAVPIDLFDGSSSSDGDDGAESLGEILPHGKQRMGPSFSAPMSLTTFAKDIDELHHIVRHVLCVYAREEAGGYGVDSDGLKMFEKTKAAPLLTEEERIVQYSAIRVVAISLLGKKRVGSWPDAVVDRGHEVEGAPGVGSCSLSEIASMKSLEEFTCNVCKELMYEPVTTLCGHSFCRSCLIGWMDWKNKRFCPSCRHNIHHNWRVPINHTIWNAMQLLYPEKLKQRKVDVEAAEAERRPRKQASKKRRVEEMVPCPNCGILLFSTRMTEHVNLCNDAPVFNDRRLRRRTRVAAGSRSPARLPAPKRRKREPRAQEPSPSSVEEEEAEKPSPSEPAVVEQENGGITIMCDSDGRKIGAIDKSAVFHMRSGLDHLALMEIRRLRALGKLLKDFHPGIVQHMASLHEAKIKRGEVGAGDMTLLPKLEVFGSEETRVLPLNSSAVEDTAGAGTEHRFFSQCVIS